VRVPHYFYAYTPREAQCTLCPHGQPTPHPHAHAIADSGKGHVIEGTFKRKRIALETDEESDEQREVKREKVQERLRGRKS
jgi:hypothetical protein